MGTSSKELAQKLLKLAKRQHGCFTAAQALDVGYADSVHLYHVKNGEWIRVFRGVYRLAEAPATSAARCMACLLWTRDKNGKVLGALAQETAEALRNGTLTAAQPVQIVVPKGFRRSSDVPDGIQITLMDPRELKTSKINGLATLEAAVQPPKPSSSAPAGLDAPDYYDWLDYQAVLCPQKP